MGCWLARIESDRVQSIRLGLGIGVESRVVGLAVKHVCQRGGLLCLPSHDRRSLRLIIVAPSAQRWTHGPTAGTKFRWRHASVAFIPLSCVISRC